MADSSPIRLLLIEDSDIDAMFVTRLLQSNPKITFKIDHATTLADALVLLREIEFDASLVDLHLPDAVELEAFEQIRALDARIPIVVFTGSDDETVRIWDVARGGDPQVSMLRGHTAPVSIVAVSPEDEMVATGGDEGKAAGVAMDVAPVAAPARAEALGHTTAAGGELAMWSC